MDQRPNERRGLLNWLKVRTLQFCAAVSGKSPPMSTERAGTLDEKLAQVRAIVDQLIETCQGHESDEWMARFVAIREALDREQYHRAVYVEAQMPRICTKWVVSGDLAFTLQKSMEVFHRHVSYPNHLEPVAILDELPTDVTARGTIEGQREALIARIKKGRRIGLNWCSVL